MADEETTPQGNEPTEPDVADTAETPTEPDVAEAAETPPEQAASMPDAGSAGDLGNLIDQAELEALVQGMDQQGTTAAASDAGESDLEAEMAAAIAAETGAASATSAAPAAENVEAEPAPAQASPEQGPALLGSSAPAPASATAGPVAMPDLTEEEVADAATQIDLLDDVELDVKIELGRTQMYIEDVLRLGEGSVVSLDKLAGDPVDIYVNERLVARGEVLVLNENFCVRVNDIINPADDEDEK